MSDTLSWEAGVVPPLWGMRRRRLKTSRRVAIGLLVALLELIGFLLLLLSFNGVGRLCNSGAGQGALLFSSFSGAGTSSNSDTPPLKTTHPNRQQAATKKIEADIIKLNPVPPTPIPTPALVEASLSETPVSTMSAASDALPADTENASGAGAPAGSTGKGGNSAYDPYAGASPQYRADTSPSSAQSTDAAPADLLAWLTGLPQSQPDKDAAFVAQLRIDIVHIDPKARGTIGLDILTDTTGKIIDIRVLQTTAPKPLVSRTRLMAFGRMAGAATPGWRSLPTLIF